MGRVGRIATPRRTWHLHDAALVGGEGAGLLEDEGDVVVDLADVVEEARVADRGAVVGKADGAVGSGGEPEPRDQSRPAPRPEWPAPRPRASMLAGRRRGAGGRALEGAGSHARRSAKRLARGGGGGNRSLRSAGRTDGWPGTPGAGGVAERRPSGVCRRREGRRASSQRPATASVAASEARTAGVATSPTPPTGHGLAHETDRAPEGARVGVSGRGLAASCPGVAGRMTGPSAHAGARRDGRRPRGRHARGDGAGGMPRGVGGGAGERAGEFLGGGADGATAGHEIGGHRRHPPPMRPAPPTRARPRPRLRRAGRCRRGRSDARPSRGRRPVRARVLADGARAGGPDPRVHPAVGRRAPTGRYSQRPPARARAALMGVTRPRLRVGVLGDSAASARRPAIAATAPRRSSRGRPRVGPRALPMPARPVAPALSASR